MLFLPVELVGVGKWLLLSIIQFQRNWAIASAEAMIDMIAATRHDVLTSL